MAALRSALLLLASSGFAFGGEEHGEHCTKGMLLISDKTAAEVHVYDLDGNSPTKKKTLSVSSAATSLYATESSLSYVVVRNRGDTAVQGTVQFISSGLSAHDHGDETHIVKSTPTVFDFQVTGWRPTHLTSSHGYITIFMDGSAADGYNSSAVFVEEAALQSLTATSDVTEVHLEGAHHGVAYALGGGRYFTSVTASSGSALPDNFIVTDAAGNIMTEVGTESAPSCPGYHGGAYLDDTWIFGCGSGGLLRVRYDADATTPAVQWDRVENPLDGTYRTGTVRSSKGGGVFVADFYISGSASARHLWSVLPTTSETFDHHLMGLNRIVDARTDCSYVLDRAAATRSGGVLVAVMHDEGNLTVTLVGADGIPTTSKDVPVFPGGLACNELSLVAGNGEVYILDRSTPQLVTVDLHDAFEGNANAISHMTLPFTPNSGALSLPPALACEHDMDVPVVSNAVSHAPSKLLVALAIVMLALWRA